MADTESLGPSGVAWLEQLATLPKEQRRVRIPTITDPRGKVTRIELEPRPGAPGSRADPASAVGR